MKKRIFRAFLLIAVLGYSAIAEAAERSDAISSSTTLDQASQIATNPTAYNTSFQVQPTYMELEPSGNFTQLLLRLVLPAQGFFIPNLKVSDFFTIYRFEAPGGNVNMPKANAFGLNDATFTTIAVKPGKALAWAFGGEAIFPTATNNLLGLGKYQLAPTFIALTQSIPHLLIGIFVQNFFSVGGQEDRPHLNYLNLQPILTVYLPATFFVTPNVQYIEDWTGQGGTQVQLSLGVGRAFTKNFVITFTPQYILSGPNQNAPSYQLNFNFQGW
jgi:hypothetical protein